MDCKNARLLLDFARPVPGDLDALEAEALQQHLNQCADCGPLAQSERRFDEAIGKAMVAVAVPDGLRMRLLARLDRERDAFYRRFVARRILPMAAAAAVLLVLGVMGWQWSQKPRALELEKLQVAASKKYQADEEEVNVWLRSLGDNNLRAPAQFRYEFLEDFFVSELEGQRVPTLFFVRANKAGERFSARVYVLSDKRFDLNELAKQSQSLPKSGLPGQVRVEALTRPADPIMFLVLYTGQELDPFLDPVKKSVFH